MLLLETTEAYKQAKKILSDRFGNPFLVANAYRKKIGEWPKIPPNDGTRLRKFSDFLVLCQTAMRTVKYLNVRDDPDENQRMVQKLPRYLIDRWSREVDHWLNRDEEQRHHEENTCETGYPPFSAFCRFLQTGSWIACNPVTAVRRDEVGREDESRGRSKMMNSNRKPQMEAARTLDAGSHEVQRGSSLTKGERRPEPTSCPLCKMAHDLDECKQFLKESVDRRR